MRNNNKKNKNIIKSNNILDWLIHIIVYALILTFISVMLNTIDIDKSYFGIYALLAAIIIYLLNKTVKPILFRLTIPITGITLGLFYPCINILILKITDFILGTKFETKGIITLFLTAILISVMNSLLEKIIEKIIIKKGDKNE